MQCPSKKAWAKGVREGVEKLADAGPPPQKNFIGFLSRRRGTKEKEGEGKASRTRQGIGSQALLGGKGHLQLIHQPEGRWR